MIRGRRKYNCAVNTRPDITVQAVDWKAHREALHAIRRTVFIAEQNVPEELEWDEIDAHCRHVMALAPGGAPIGTGRLLPDGHIGRMAVLKEWRGRGVGSAILDTLLALARRAGFETVRLHAQTYAVGFYAKHGFTAIGEEFMEAGIPHREMAMKLDPLPSLERR
jgi:predicted GNAT family N-acyltransferase